MISPIPLNPARIAYKNTSIGFEFKNKSIDHLKVIKGETQEDIQAISGATISTRAVTEDAVKNGVAFLIKTVKEGGNTDVSQQH